MTRSDLGAQGLAGQDLPVLSAPEVSSGRTRSPVMVDVARLAGVSHQTVSRVLNRNPSVSEPVRQRVELAIAQLGYRRNTTARALATQRTMNIGVISVGTSQYGPSLTLLGIAAAARQAGYTTSLVTLGDSEVDRRGMHDALDHLLDNAVDGIVLVAPVAAAVAAADGLSVKVPMVLFQPGAAQPTDRRSRVAVDEIAGARLATRHLLDLGHDTVWHLSGPEGWLGTDARIRGWRDELDAHGRAAPAILTGDWSAASGFSAGLVIAERPEISAVFVANDQMALGLLQALHQANRSVPGDVSVVGFDDLPESAYYQPALTTVRLDFAEVGRRCVLELLALIEPAALNGHRERPAVRSGSAYLIPPEIIVRASTAAPRR